jgi:hypothetical protein
MMHNTDIPSYGNFALDQPDEPSQLPRSHESIVTTREIAESLVRLGISQDDAAEIEQLAVELKALRHLDPHDFVAKLRELRAACWRAGVKAGPLEEFAVSRGYVAPVCELAE